MEIVGYSDRLSVRAGERVAFKVSTPHPEYAAELVRLIRGNTDPAGRGFVEERVEGAFDGRYPGKQEPLRIGSYIQVDAPTLPTGSFTVQAWLYPTTPGEGRRQAIVAAGGPRSGWALCIGEHGGLELRIADGERVESITAALALRAFDWFFVAMRFDTVAGTVSFRQQPVRRLMADNADGRITMPVSAAAGLTTDGPLWLATLGLDDRGCPEAVLNGKLDRPRLFDRHLNDSELDRLAAGTPADVIGGVLADFDLSVGPATTAAHDAAGRQPPGVVVNAPMRAVTGWNFSGRETDWRLVPHEYGAVFFHDDDLDDAGWTTDFSFDVPDDLPSGIYAARLRVAEGEEHIPFFVRPPSGRANSDVAFLVPTLSYIAYANDHITWRNPAIETPPEILARLQAEDHYAIEQRLNSLYDHHRDGTGVAFSSRMRPIVNMRPRYRLAITGVPHQFSGDLDIVDWLHVQGVRGDVVTDEDVHHEGLSALADYRVVLTGHHPEYWTWQMMQALRDYLDNGGRVMYLGGNGLYWVVSVDPERPHLIEIRRGFRGTALWRSAVGEHHHQTTGEQGGLWRDRGWAPQALVGAGMAAQGIGPARPYHRQPGSHDPRAAFIFDGVGADEVIGDFGFALGGAGGIEVDRFDQRLGTPAHALLLATTTGFNDQYQHVVEEVEQSDSKQSGSVSPFVRGDVVFFETLGGGAVFSVSSMTWCAALAWNDYDNNVSRITGNVLRRFRDPTPFRDARLFPGAETRPAQAPVDHDGPNGAYLTRPR